jgi:uncharacterized membrane protein YtjA (UPF0391 family)
MKTRPGGICLPCGMRARTGKLSASLPVPSEVARMKSTPNANADIRTRLPMDAVLLRLWQEEIAVLYYALVFLVVALIAGVLGVSGVAGVATQIAWVLFVIGIILLIVNFLTGNRPRSVV